MRTRATARALSILLLLGVLALSVNAWATDAQGLTWDELKKVQGTERADMIAAQRETLAKIAELQKEALRLAENFVAAQDVKDLSQRLAEERKEMTRIQGEERTELAKTHAEERKSFLAAQGSQKASP